MATSRLPRWGRSRCLDPSRASSTRAWERALSEATSPTATGSTSRATADGVGCLWASPTPGTSARSASIRAIRTVSTSRRRGTPSDRTRNAACSARRTAAVAGNGCSVRASAPERRTSRSTRTSRTSCTRACGKCTATSGNSRAVARGAVCGVRPMEGIPGRTCARGCPCMPRPCSARSASPPPRPAPAGCGRSSNRTPSRGSTAPTTSGRPGLSQASARTSATGPGTTCTCSRIRRTRTPSTSATSRCGSRPMGARASRGFPPRTATITICGSIRATTAA